VIGGETNIRIFNITEVYDPESDTWETKSEFQTWREFPVVNAVDEKIYLMAGLRRGFESAGGISKTEMYDPETDIWTTGASIPSFGNIQLGTLPSAVLDECIYLMHENITYIYDTQNDAWSYGATSPIKIYGAVAGATTGEFASKRIHLLKMSLHYVYDPENDSWTQETPMLTSRSYVGVAVVNDEIYVIGGYDGENYRNENEKYTPQGYIPEFSSWIILPLLLTATLIAVLFKKRLATTVSNS
jgi:N-acetylneuraminic acid mutarotase